MEINDEDRMRSKLYGKRDD